MSNDGVPLVSIRLMVYNHAKFLRQAMDGIMEQRTTFPVEVVVGDDFSTDGSLDIVKEYQDTPNIKIKILNRSVGDEYWQNRQRYGRLYNFLNILENCKGKYIALLDGDDYWIDQLKLQKQVDFLQNHPDFSMVFHQANKLYDDGTISPFNQFDVDRDFQFKDLIERNFIATGSVLYRNHYEPLPSWFLSLQAGDWGLHLINSQQGKIRFLSSCMSVYRKHDNGVWNQLSSEQVARKNIQNLQVMDRAFNYNYHTEFNSAVEKRLRQINRKKNSLTRVKSCIMKRLLPLLKHIKILK